ESFSPPLLSGSGDGKEPDNRRLLLSYADKVTVEYVDLVRPARFKQLDQFAPQPAGILVCDLIQQSGTAISNFNGPPLEIISGLSACIDQTNFDAFSIPGLDKPFGCHQQVGIETSAKTPVCGNQQKLNLFDFLLGREQ